MVASPFRAILGDGGGTVSVAGKPGYLWARRLGQEEVVFQAYNRAVSSPNEGRVVLVQESRIEGLQGYEIIGSAGGDLDISTTVEADVISAATPGATVTIGDMLTLETGPNLTIAGGVITVTHSFHRVDTEGAAAADDLDTIYGGVNGSLLILGQVAAAQDVTLTNNTDNLRLAGDFTLDTISSKIMLVKSGANWHEISRSSN